MPKGDLPEREEGSRTLPEPIGCDVNEARRYLGMSECLFDEYRARRVIRPVRKGYYHYQDLDDAARAMRKERDQREGWNTDDQEPEANRRAPKPRKPVRGKRNKSYEGLTRERLRQLAR